MDGLKKKLNARDQSISLEDKKIIEHETTAGTMAVMTERAGPAPTRRIQVTLSEPNFLELERRSERTGASISSIIAIAVDEYLHDPEEQAVFKDALHRIAEETAKLMSKKEAKQ